MHSTLRALVPIACLLGSALACDGEPPEKAVVYECDSAVRLPYDEVADEEIDEELAGIIELYLAQGGTRDALITCGEATRSGPITIAPTVAEDVEVWLPPEEMGADESYECDSLGFAPFTIESFPVLPNDGGENIELDAPVSLQTDAPDGVHEGVGLLGDVEEGGALISGYAWTAQQTDTETFLSSVFINVTIAEEEATIRLNLEYVSSSDGPIVPCTLRF